MCEHDYSVWIHYCKSYLTCPRTEGSNNNRHRIIRAQRYILRCGRTIRKCRPYRSRDLTVLDKRDDVAVPAITVRIGHVDRVRTLVLRRTAALSQECSKYRSSREGSCRRGSIIAYQNSIAVGINYREANFV